jgi:hypothetical protein
MATGVLPAPAPQVTAVLRHSVVGSGAGGRPTTRGVGADNHAAPSLILEDVVRTETPPCRARFGAVGP